MQFFLAAAALAAIFLTIKSGKNSSRAVSIIIAFFWLWMGAAYHLLFFSKINPAAIFFGAFFIVQSAIFLYAGALKNDLSFRFRLSAEGVIGISLIIYALIVYPLFGFIFGHYYPYSPTFGLPCPTTIYTFGLLLWTVKKVPWYVLPIPFLWSFIGFSAAFTLGIREDFGLPVAGIIGTAMIWRRSGKISASSD